MSLRQMKRAYRRTRSRIRHAKNKRERELFYQFFGNVNEKSQLKEKEEEQKQKLNEQQETPQSGGCLSSIFWLFVSVCFIIYLFQSCGNLF